MECLEVGNGEYNRSVAFDATNVDGTVVTVGVEVTREQEAALLNICCEEQGDQYVPFATKSKDLDVDNAPIKNLINRFSGRIAVGLCEGDSVKLHRAEPAHSAALYHELAPFESDPVVIADGDETQAKRITAGLRAVDRSTELVVPCHRSELYYPHSYFADLLAARIAREYDETEEFPQDAFYAVVRAKGNSELFWEVHNKIGRNNICYQPPDYEERHAQRQPTRTKSWFTGGFGSNSGDQPETDSTTRVENWLKGNGYAAAAGQIS